MSGSSPAREGDAPVEDGAGPQSWYDAGPAGARLVSGPKFLEFQKLRQTSHGDLPPPGGGGYLNSG